MAPVTRLASVAIVNGPPRTFINSLAGRLSERSFGCIHMTALAGRSRKCTPTSTTGAGKTVRLSNSLSAIIKICSLLPL